MNQQLAPERQNLCVSASPFRAVIFDFGHTLFHSPSGVDGLVGAGLDPARAGQLWEDIWTASKPAEELARGRDLSVKRHREAWLGLLERAEPFAPGVAALLYEQVMAHDHWLPYPDAGR